MSEETPSSTRIRAHEVTLSQRSFPDYTQVRKPCWTCQTYIPYHQGWCESCWKDLKSDRQNIANLAFDFDNTLRGAIHKALCESLLRERAPKAEPRKNFIYPKKTTLSLEDLGL